MSQNPTIITSAGTANAYATNELLVDMSEKRWKSFPELTALTTILLRLGKDPAHNFRVDLTEENEIPTKVKTAAAMAAAGSSLVVQAFGVTLVLDTILWNPRTDEYLRVTANPTTNTIAVTNYSGTTAITNLDDDLFVLPPALAENDANYRKSSAIDTNVYNYTQVMKLQFGINRLANSMSTLFGGAGSKRLQLQRQKFREFRVKDEQQKWFGARTSSGTAPATRYGSNGIKSILKDGTLYKDFGGVFTESGFDNYLGSYYDQNPDKKKIAFFAAPNVIRQIGYFAKNKIRLSPGSMKAYGINVNQYFGGAMDIDLIPVPVFVYSQETKGWGFILDLERIMIKEIDKLVLHQEALNVGQSEEIIDTYRAVDSLLLANEAKHSMMVGADL